MLALKETPPRREENLNSNLAAKVTDAMGHFSNLFSFCSMCPQGGPFQCANVSRGNCAKRYQD